MWHSGQHPSKPSLKKLIPPLHRAIPLLKMNVDHLKHVFFSLLIHFCITCVCYIQLFTKILALLSYSELVTNSQLLF